MELQSLVAALTAFGWQGLVFALVILIGVFIGRKAGLVATGDHARLANIILSAILFGLSGDPSAQTALESVMASLVAALVYEGLKRLPFGKG